MSNQIKITNIIAIKIAIKIRDDNTSQNFNSKNAPQNGILHVIIFG